MPGGFNHVHLLVMDDAGISFHMYSTVPRQNWASFLSGRTSRCFDFLPSQFPVQNLSGCVVLFQIAGYDDYDITRLMHGGSFDYLAPWREAAMWHLHMIDVLG